MYNANQEEQEILRYWDEHQCFVKSIANRSAKKPYHFYDGPPFATGLPHYGHIVASLMKDVVPRYFTMRGYRVERKWGWDCHGLPIENIIEKELNLSTKKEIEAYGIDKFNEACRATVLKYAREWEKTIKRIGRWVDMKNDYKTMDPSFMESVWWVFKQLWDRGLIYKDYKAMHICPRCATTLSNFEVTQGYKDIKDISVVAKFKIKEGYQSKFDFLNVKGPIYILAWTTTPWTLPGNVLLAVNPDIEYLLLDIEEEGKYIIARERVETVLKDKKYKEMGRYKGSDLVGLEYEPLFPYFADTLKAFRVVAAEFVTTTDGTGIVHIAPAFGEEDFKVGKAEGLPLVQHVSMDGKFVPAVTDFAGMDVKPKDDVTKADVEIIKWLAHNGKLFSKEKIEHSYPHCWRCDTPLLNYATTSWFVRVTQLKDQLLKNNAKINWVPKHIKQGRFGVWLEGARDWAISRSRYWGTPLPIWEGEDGEVVCVGSIEELEKLSGEKVTDLHKHFIDGLIITKDGKKYKRIPEVLDCWFESGSMPYGQMHYPFENKKKFEASFPAGFIAEGQDQTRGWFYTLHVLATALTMGQKPAIPVKKSEPAFKNVIVNGIVLAEDGKKMSKRLKNYPEPEIVLEKYGADAMRYYLATSPVMQAEALNFSEAGVREMYNKLINTVYNVLEFYLMFAGSSSVIPSPFDRLRVNSAEGSLKHSKRDSSTRQKASVGMTTTNVLDKWILAKLQILIKDVTAGMEAYKLADASRPIVDFVTELSQWYVRRSRDRFKWTSDFGLQTSNKTDGEADKNVAIETLREVLLTLSKVMAPFTPFMAEKIYKAVGGEMESVHLEDWPTAVKASAGEALVIFEMEDARKTVETALALRAEKGIKVRQPLNKLTIFYQVEDGIKQIIADELNVKNVEVVKGSEADKNKVSLDTVITDELKKEGLLREVVRTINQIRKDQKMTIADRVIVKYSTDDVLLKSVFVDCAETIKKSVLAGFVEEGEAHNEVVVEGVNLKIEVIRLT